MGTRSCVVVSPATRRNTSCLSTKSRISFSRAVMPRRPRWVLPLLVCFVAAEVGVALRPMMAANNQAMEAATRSQGGKDLCGKKLIVTYVMRQKLEKKKDEYGNSYRPTPPKDIVIEFGPGEWRDVFIAKKCKRFSNREMLLGEHWEHEYRAYCNGHDRGGVVQVTPIQCAGQAQRDPGSPCDDPADFSPPFGRKPPEDPRSHKRSVLLPKDSQPIQFRSLSPRWTSSSGGATITRGWWISPLDVVRAEYFPNTEVFTAYSSTGNDTIANHPPPYYANGVGKEEGKEYLDIEKVTMKVV